MIEPQKDVRDMSVLEAIMSEKSISLPDGWSRCRLKDVALINPRRPSHLDRSDDAHTSFVPMEAVDSVTGTIRKPLMRPFVEIKKGYTFFHEGDVLFAKITPCMQNGKHAIARDLIDGIGFGTTEFHVLRPGHQVVAEWIYYFLRQSALLREATEHFTGAVGQQRLPEDYLANIEILLPPLSEQKRIASILNKQMAAVERARKAVEERFEAVQALHIAYLCHAFPQPGQYLPKAWRWEKFGDLAELKNGINFTADQKGKGILTVDVLNMYSNSIYISMDELYRVNINPSHEYLLQPNDILIVRSSVKREGVGWPNLFSGHTEPVTFCGFLIRARLISKQISSQFIVYYLRQQHIRDLVVGKSGTGTITNISQMNLKTIEIPIPPLKEQNRITWILEKQMDRVRQMNNAAKEEQLAIDTLPSALLRRAFSGEL